MPGALLQLGFRPFFSGAGLFAIAGIASWMLVYTNHWSLQFNSLSPTLWHAHEMIFGYAMAVIAGFLLTAVRNWTGVQTAQGWALAALFVLWLTARIAMLMGEAGLKLAAASDLLFCLGLAVAVVKPIVQVKQWRQVAIVSKLVLLGGCNAVFYLVSLGCIEGGLQITVYAGLYLVIGLILTMGRRILPMFIQNGVGYPVTLRNSRVLDISSLVLFLLFFVSELFMHNAVLTAWVCLALFVVNAIRLVGWHTPGIWRKSLLWVLYLSFWCICLGFLLFAAVHFHGISKFLAVHAFAYGGIGVITLGMMSRVALGHTGRSIAEPPRGIALAFGLLIAGVLVRVIAPIMLPAFYLHWLVLAQWLWIAAFALFVLLYLPMLWSPRVDGKPG